MLKNRKGITLVELILVIALIGIVIPVAYSIFDLGNLSFSMSTNKGFSQQDVRLVGNFIASEMTYITDLALNEEDLNTEYQDYYSLKVENINGRNFLTRTFHEYKVDSDEEDPNPYNTDDIKRVSGYWDKIEIRYGNTEDEEYTEDNGSIKVLITQTEGTGRSETKYELPLSINMINNPYIENEIEIDLMMNIDSGSYVIYYQKAINTNANIGIDILPNEGGGGGKDDTGDTGGNVDLEQLYFTDNITVKGNNSHPIDPKNGIYEVGNNNKYTIEVYFYYSGELSNLDTTAVGVVNSVNTPKINHNKVILEDRTSNNGNSYQVDLSISEKSGQGNDTITIKISE